MAKDKTTRNERDALKKRALNYPEHTAYIEMTAECYNGEGIAKINNWLNTIDISKANKCGKI